MEENQSKNVGIEEVLPETSSKKTAIRKYFSTSKLATIAVFTGLSIVLYYYVKTPLPILFPSFLDFQVSDVPALIAAFIFGPVEAMVIVLCKILAKLPSTGTFFVGELADLMIGTVFVLPAGLIYRKIRSKKGALIGLAVGVLSSTVAAIFINRFITVPFYATIYPGGMEGIVKTVGKLYKGLTVQNFYNFYLWLGVLPFNLIRGSLSAILTYFLYGHLEKAVKYIFHKH